jgi:hypothetical protein
MRFTIYVNTLPLITRNFKDLHQARSIAEKLKKTEGTIFIYDYNSLDIVANKPERQAWRFPRNKK